LEKLETINKKNEKIIEDRNQEIKELNDSIELSVGMEVQNFVQQFNRLKDMETSLFIGQIVYNFEKQVRKDKSLEDTYYFNNLPVEIKESFKNYEEINYVISSIKEYRVGIAHPTIDETDLSMELFTGFCTKKKLCSEELAKYIYQYATKK
jgi:hypothetical protein